MPSSYSPLLRIELQASGENDTTWGDKTNDNFEDVIERAIAGAAAIGMSDAEYTLTANSGAPDEAKNMMLLVTGALTAARNIIVPTLTKLYVVRNATTGGFGIVIKTAAGTGATVVNGESAIVYCDGTNVEMVASRMTTGEVVPAKIATSEQLWRLDSVLGVNRAQPLVPGYGAVGIDGSLGSFVTLFAGGVHVGALLAEADQLTIESVSEDVAIEIGGEAVLVAQGDGDVLVQRNLEAVNVIATGDVSATTFTSAGGYTGLLYANVITALGYTPVQKGSVNGYNSAVDVSFGYGTGGVLRAAIAGTDIGRVLTDATTGVYMTLTGSNASHTLASASASADHTAAALTIREVNHGGAQGGNTAYAPRLAFFWNGVNAAQITINAAAHLNFVDSTGTGYVATTAQHGYFIDNITTGVSDDRLKNRAGNIRGALSKVCQLNGFHFTYNDTAKELGVKDRKKHIGLSAQEVKALFPSLVSRAPCDTTTRGKKIVSKSGNDYMTVDYEGLIPVLVEAIKELKTENDQMKRRVSAMEKKQ